MNIIFSIIFIISVTVTLFSNPDGVITAMTDGANKAVTLSIGLVSIYTIWSGLLKIAQEVGLINKLSKLLSPIIKKLFPKANSKTRDLIAVNVGANILGLGGIATPSGINATTLMTDNDDYDGSCLLFILATTSLQLIPSTVISLRLKFNSLSPADIFLPTLLSTMVSTTIGVFLFFLTKKYKKS